MPGPRRLPNLLDPAHRDCNVFDQSCCARQCDNVNDEMNQVCFPARDFWRNPHFDSHQPLSTSPTDLSKSSESMDCVNDLPIRLDPDLPIRLDPLNIFILQRR
eukprot:s4503_g2.t1